MFTLKFLASFIFCFILCDGKRVFRCDYKYVSEIGAWLKFQEIPADWHEARLRCRLEGGNIASPSTVALKEAMASILEQHQVQITYTGINAIFSKGDYSTIEGIPLQQIPHTWSPGEPNEFYGNKNCLVMFKDGTLADTKCTESYRYICYKQFKKHEVVSSCGTVDPDYYLDTRTGNCYKFHKTARTWSRAHMTCSAEGGYLAIINSETEAQVIRDIFARNPDDSIHGNVISLRKDLVFVGFNDWSEHGDWLTVHGETLKQAGYDHFAPGEPNNSTDGEYCGSVNRNGLLNDLWCETQFLFICEKSPDSLLCKDDKL